MSSLNGFTIKPFAPLFTASITFCCQPSDVIITTSGIFSSFFIYLRQAIPSMSGIVISRVTISGSRVCIFIIAAMPFSASPTTSKPYFSNMSFNVFLIKAASSTINTFFICLYL